MTWRLPENPFVGLRPFEIEETLLFFGRQEQTRDLLQQLHETRFLGVVGSSGCGKSSLIRAGLIPRLLGGFLVDDRDTWLVARMKPGEAPILNLAKALHQAAIGSEDQPDVTRIVKVIHEQGLEGVLDYLAPLMQPTEANLLLLVDQFEEIFRFSDLSRTHQGLEEAAQFVTIMLSLAEQRQLHIYVTMTMRSDYLGKCDAFLGLPEALNRSQYLVPRLTRKQRREAIEGPIRLYRGKISDRLVDRLLNETGEARDDLPIMQHALMRTWDYAHTSGGPTKDGTLDLVHYETIGTVKGALSQHAEEARWDMDPRDRSLAKQLFQALTEVDPGNLRVRRPVNLSEVTAITGATPEELWQVIQKFRSQGRSFLVLSSENPEDDPLIDISHESLIRQWERLNRWVDEEVESAEIYQRLARTARLHREDKADFYHGPELQIAVNWRDTKQPNHPWAKRYDPDFEEALDFLRLSEEESERKRAEREAARQREQEYETALAVAALEKQRAEEQTLAATKLRRRALYLTVAMILAIVASIFTFVAQDRAEANAQLAEQRANTATIAQGEAILAQGTAEAYAQLAIMQGNLAITAQATAATLSAINNQYLNLLSTQIISSTQVIGELIRAQGTNEALLRAANIHTPTPLMQTSTELPSTTEMVPTPTPILPIPPFDGAEIIFIPEGTFQMGSDPESDPYFAGAESPIHTVFLNAYRIYKHEVTNGMYDKCVQAGFCNKHLISRSSTRSDYYANLEFADYPVVFVSWEEANAYCTWAGGRLPTEAEWEKAARGDQDKRLFPWGYLPTGERANYCDRNCQNTPRDLTQNDGFEDTAPVGSFPAGASPYGVLDMAGNVLEWTQDWFLPSYYLYSPEENPTGPEDGGQRVTRGGSFIDQPEGIRAVSRRGDAPEKTRLDYLGFRCVVDVLD